MAATRPYIRTGFVTVTNGAPASSFKTLSNHYKVGVVFLTVTETYFTDANVTHEHIYDSNDEMLAALNSKEIDAALMWRPWLDRELAAHPQKLNQAPLRMPHAQWNIVALYPEGQRDDAVQKFNAGIETLRKSGTLAQIVNPEGVPGT
jgi:ABC-type amino acid transport substrate-binding protein